VYDNSWKVAFSGHSFFISSTQLEAASSLSKYLVAKAMTAIEAISLAVKLGWTVSETSGWLSSSSQLLDND